MKLLKWIIVLILLIASLNGTSQSPIDSLISLMPAKFSAVEHYMYTTGWQYEGLDSADGLCAVWNDENNDNEEDDFSRSVKIFYQSPNGNSDAIARVEYINFSDFEFGVIVRKLALLSYALTTRENNGIEISWYSKTVSSNNKAVAMVKGESMKAGRNHNLAVIVVRPNQ